MGNTACELRGDENCSADYLAEIAIEKSAYNKTEVAPLRARLQACRKDPSPWREGVRGRRDLRVRPAR